MKGGVIQNGLIPGTMAMPSLHIGLTAITAWFLYPRFGWTGWISAFWLTLIWLSTVFLGWHYILDGLGGILVSVISIFLSYGTEKPFKVINF